VHRHNHGVPEPTGFEFVEDLGSQIWEMRQLLTEFAGPSMPLQLVCGSCPGLLGIDGRSVLTILLEFIDISLSARIYGRASFRNCYIIISTYRYGKKRITLIIADGCLVITPQVLRAFAKRRATAQPSAMNKQTEDSNHLCDQEPALLAINKIVTEAGGTMKVVSQMRGGTTIDILPPILKPS